MFTSAVLCVVIASVRTSDWTGEATKSAINGGIDKIEIAKNGFSLACCSLNQREKEPIHDAAIPTPIVWIKLVAKLGLIIIGIKVANCNKSAAKTTFFRDLNLIPK